MRSVLTAKSILAAVVMLAGGTAQADFWSDAGANYKGVTITACPNPRRRRTMSRTCWRPRSPRRPASTSISRRRPGTRCTTRRSRTWRPIPASMTSSISSRTSSTAYLARNFLVDITQSLADDPALKAPRLRASTTSPPSSTTSRIRPRTTTSSACRWRPSSRSTSIGRICSTTPTRRRHSRTKYRLRSGAGQDPRGIHRDRRVLHPMGQGPRHGALGLHGAGPYRPPGLVVRVLRSRRADLRRLQLGHQTPTRTMQPQWRTAAR